jgi:hypothetical protein
MQHPLTQNGIMNERARRLWSQTRVHVWPEVSWLVSLPPDAVREAAALVTGIAPSPSTSTSSWTW